MFSELDYISEKLCLWKKLYLAIIYESHVTFTLTQTAVREEIMDGCWKMLARAGSEAACKYC